MTRIVQVSDSHLSPAAPYSDANWQAVVAHVRATKPDLVIHTGDISLNGADSLDDLLHARKQLARLDVPWMAIPGNHDVGDAGDELQPVNDVRRGRYGRVFGDSSWMSMLDGWRLVGVDIQTLVSDLDAAPALWDWLDDALSGEVRTALFLHRPLRPWRVDEVDDPNRYVTEPARSRLATLIDAGDVRLVASGHVHQWRSVVDATQHVWAPSSWAMLPDSIQPVIGVKTVGLVEHDLQPDGTVTSTLVHPDGIAQVTGGESFVSPYSLMYGG